MRKSSGVLSKDFNNITIVNMIIYSIIVIMPFVVVPKTIQPYIVGKAIYLYLIGIVLCLLMLFDRVKHKLSFEFKLEEKILGIFFISLIIATIFSVDIETAVMGKTGRYEGLIILGIYIILFIVTNRYNKFTLKIMNVIGVVSSIMGIYTITQFYGIDPLIKFLIFNDTSVDSYGTIGNRNYAGTYFLILLIIILSVYIIYNKKMFLVYSSILFGGLLAALTRSCWVGFIISALVALILLRKRKECLKRCLVIILIFVSIFLVLNITSNNKIVGRTNELINDMKDFNGSSGSGRVRIWDMVLKSIYKKPILGTGLDTLDSRLVLYQPNEFWDLAIKSGIVDKAHNEFLEYWACGGLVTVLSYISLISVILYKLFKHREDDISKIFMLTIVGYIVQSFFNNSVIAVAPLYWILLGAAVKHYRDLDKAKAVQAIAD